MSARPTLVTADERRRLAALHRLAAQVDPGAVDLDLVPALHVLAAGLRADGVVVWTVHRDGAIPVAGVGPATSRVPGDGRLAEAAVAADGLVTDAATGASREPGGWSSTGGPTSAALPVRAAGGEGVAALTLRWDGERDLAGVDRATLDRAAEHLGHLLELRAEVAEYRRFVALSPDALTVLDLEGAIQLANPAMAALLGVSDPEELLGRPFLELVARQDRARVTAELARVLFARDRSVQLDLELFGSDGRDVPCSVSAGHLAGPHRHLQLVVHDLSDRLRAEEERTRLSEQLARAQRLDAVGRIAGGLAHDLNNLLVIMVSNLGLAEESLTAATRSAPDAPLDEVAEDLAELRTAVDRATGLTDKLLQFARRESSAGGPTDVAAVLGTVASFIGRSLGPEVRLEVEVSDDLPLVAVDEVQLERVLVNLVINARDALEDGAGEIRLRAGTSAPDGTSAVERRETSRPAGREDPLVFIEVVDDGLGMDLTTQARAFEPLFTTRADGGTGLGLATVLSFVDEVDGGVGLASSPGEGTTVTLTLPAVAEVEEEPTPRGEAPVGGARVVLVDPGERTQRVIGRMLRGAGYHVRAFADGEAALAALDEEPASLLVTELVLPAGSGTRLLEAARERQPALRGVLLTSVDGPRTLDGDPVLAKPFSHARLLRTVSRVLGGA